MSLKNKRILLGVTGGIAAYKALELTRLFIKAGAEVRPVMTRAAAEFITPLSLSTLARSKVYSTMFDVNERFDIDHISLAQECDIIVVAPATANIIAKAATGIADDLLSTVIAAATVPLLFAPAMNTAMWNSPVLQENIKKLSALGFNFVEPAVGELACGYEGKGKLAEVDTIFASVKEALGSFGRKEMAGERVLVTAGPTREPIDPVRYVSNSSSGKMGYALASAAKESGADVVLVSGPTDLPTPKGVTRIDVTTADEMHAACLKEFPVCTILIMAAAVADYAPLHVSSRKIKKEAGSSLTLEMKQTKDLIKSMGGISTGQFMAGFALETQDLIDNARAKLISKGLDMVVANTPHGIGGAYNEVSILDKAGGIEQIESMKKERVAQKILNRLMALKSAVRPEQV